MAGIDNLTTIVCENTAGIDSLGIARKCLIKDTPVLERVRFTGVTWAASNLDILVKIVTLKGIDANGLNTDKAVVTGSCHVTTATEGKLVEVRATFPELTITYSTLKPDTITTFVFSSSQGKSITNSSLECNFPFTKVSQTTYKITAEDENTIKLTFKCDNHVDFTTSYLVAGTRTQSYKVTYIPLRTIRVQVYGQSIYPVEATVKIGNNTYKTDNNGYIYIRSGAAVEGTVSALGYSGSTFSFSSITNDSTSTVYVYQAVEVKFIVEDNSGSLIQGAKVSCGEETGTTNLYGECILNIGKGTRMYSVKKQNYFDFTGNVTVNMSAMTVNVTILLNVESFKPEENGNIQMMLLGNSSITINSTDANYRIDWGDGQTMNAEGIGTKVYNHVYDTNELHQVEISNCTNISSCNGTKDCLVAYWSIGNSKVVFLSFNNYNLLGCVGLIFRNDINKTSFSNCFYGCSSLTTIPVGLFDNNVNVTNFNNCFYGCKNLTTIPVGLFDNNVNVTSFSNCFYGCSSLTTIPDGLFDHNTNVTDFNNCFHECRNFTNIPVGLFDHNTSVTSFSQTFHNCFGLKSIPDGLFDNNVNVTNLSYCFCNCSGITGIPVDLFKNNVNVTNLSYCFFGCSGIVSLVPPLWISYYGKNTSSVDCFSNCTKAANWLEVPKSWGGPAEEYTPPVVSGVVLADYRALDIRLKNIEDKLNLN